MERKLISGHVLVRLMIRLIRGLGSGLLKVGHLQDELPSGGHQAPVSGYRADR